MGCRVAAQPHVAIHDQYPASSRRAARPPGARTCARAAAASRNVAASSSGTRGGVCRRTYACGSVRGRASALCAPMSASAASRTSVSADRTAGVSYPWPPRARVLLTQSHFPSQQKVSAVMII
jgi:hypothetical protein